MCQKVNVAPYAITDYCENNNYNIWGRRYYLSLFEKLVKSIFVLFEVLFVKNLKENKKLEKYINKTLFKLSKSYCD